MVPLRASACVLLSASAPALAHGPELPPGAIRAAVDRVAATSVLPVESHPLLLSELSDALSTPARRRSLSTALERFAAVSDELEAGAFSHRAPAELAAIALVESGFMSDWRDGFPTAAEEAAEPEAGAGVWMLTAAEARAHVLDVGPAIDQRLDVEASTRAAVHILQQHQLRLGSWGLAIAAYEAGYRPVFDASLAEDSLDLWTLVERGAVSDYAVRVLAAAVVIEEPELLSWKHGDHLVATR